jgi:PTH1 family peptidyl-tRNA hydrolase
MCGKLYIMRWIIVGLGNPGTKYAKTRHNAGRIALELLRKKFDFPGWEYKKTHDALESKGTIAGQEVLLLEPETYMNESGKSLVTLVKSREQAAQLIVLHDDADLPVGSWRSARDRGAGGQKGVESIIATIKTRDFYRFRVGMAPESTPDAPRRRAGDFVLEKFSADELLKVKSRNIQIAERIEYLITNGHEKFKNTIKNIRPLDP